MALSVFDLFKIGIGPSSSHTVGPMRAARLFAQRLAGDRALEHTARVQCVLYGSLGATGKGHGSDKAVLLGLAGHEPDTVDVEAVPALLHAMRRERCVHLAGRHAVTFDEKTDLVFRRRETLPFHANGLRFTAFATAGTELLQRTYYSVGGGFIVSDEVAADGSRQKVVAPDATVLPHPFRSGAELLQLTGRLGCSIAELMRRNERHWRDDDAIDAGLSRIWQVMQACVERGCKADGTLPGGFKVRRRAKALREALTVRPEEALRDPLQVLDWVNLYALAVNEENAAGGRVVTAPTNGAAGVVPAVLEYYRRFCKGDDAGVERYFLAAAAIGSLCKRNASISGAEVGCQGEVGSAAAMAAGGLAAALGATNEQVENAAEIALEHHFGMTCDPIGGLVQVPCIERNAMGAVKAINACSLAMLGDGTHLVSLDAAIETLRRTGADMQSKYKETALGGLAVTVAAPASIAQAEC